jgi:hypothetical protein
MGLNLNFNFNFINLDQPGTLNTMMVIIGVAIVLRSLKNVAPAFNFVMETISATLLIIIADYYTNYTVGLYPITCYLTAGAVLMGIFLLIGHEVYKVGYLFVGIAILSVPFVPLVDYVFYEVLYPYYWSWLIFPIVLLFFTCLLLAKQKFLQFTTQTARLAN